MQRAKTLEDALAAYEQTARREHQDMLKRKQMIEKRKEHLENLSIKKVVIVDWKNLQIARRHINIICIVVSRFRGLFQDKNFRALRTCSIFLLFAGLKIIMTGHFFTLLVILTSHIFTPSPRIRNHSKPVDESTQGTKMR